MDEFVNTLETLQKEIKGSGITTKLKGDKLLILGPGAGKTTAVLKIVRLYRPSSEDIERSAAPDTLLVLVAATQKAARTAARHNHISIPGGHRIVVPGVALVREETPNLKVSRQVRLQGRTGLIAETLLIGHKKIWSVRMLAAAANVSTTLTHRVLMRLEEEGLLTAVGSGNEKVREISNARALAELWSQEEQAARPFIRGFLYGSSSESIAKKILDIYPNAAVGGALAANSYKPILTRVNPPVKMWVPSDSHIEPLMRSGFERTEEGANVELVRSKGDPWRVNMNRDNLQRVSSWRAWLEISSIGGRTQELADALLDDLIGN